MRRGLRDLFRLCRTTSSASDALQARFLTGRLFRHGTAVPGVIRRLFQRTNGASTFVLIVINLRPIPPCMSRGLRDFFRLRRVTGRAGVTLQTRFFTGCLLLYGSGIPSVSLRFRA